MYICFKAFYRRSLMLKSKKIYKYGFKPGLPHEFEILDINEVLQSSKKALTTTHRTEFYQIIWFKEGNPIHLVDFKPLVIQPNSILFLHKDVVQQFDSNKHYTGKIILFTDSFFCKTQADTRFLKNCFLFNNLFNIPLIQIDRQVEVFELILQQMETELQQSKDSRQAELLQNLLHNFLLQAERFSRLQYPFEPQKGNEYDSVMLFKDLLEDNYKSQKQVSFYTKSLFITEKRLNQATSKLLGKTPKEFIHDRVMLEAKRILVYTTLSIKEIGYDLGFEEPTNFIKYFKKHALTTPSEFREQNRLA